jgi:hypothetical protein
MNAATIHKRRKRVLLERRWNRYARFAAIVAAVVTSLATMLGAANALWQFSWKEHEERKAAEIKQLTTFGTFADLVKNGRTMEGRTVKFARTLPKEGFTEQRLEDLYAKYGSGSAIYWSEDFKEFREIHEFYEELGLMVERESVNFELVFELVTYPSDFASDTAGLCRFIGRNWFRKGYGIAGMCDNTNKLGKRYEERRAEWQEKQ